MSSITTIGYVRRDIESLREWCRQQSATEQSISSRYAFNRTHKWFGHQVVLTQCPIIKKGYQDNRVTRFGNIVLPGWDCALLCHYHSGGSMQPHCDHQVFEPSLLLVNVGCATLEVDKEVHNLEDGQVIQFKSDVEHQLYPVQSERWSLLFRRIKPEYLPA